VRIDAQTGRTEVSIPDPTTRQVALRQVLEGPPTAALVPVLAVRTVEFVRATLLGPRNQDQRRARGEGGAPAGDAAAPDGALAGGPGQAEGERPLSALPGVALALDSGAVFTPGGLSTQVLVGLVTRLRLSPHLGAELMGFTPLTRGRVQEGAFAVHASTWLAAAGLFAREPLGSRFGVSAATGALLAVLQATGTVDMTEPAATPAPDAITGLAGAAYGRLGGDFAISRNVALRLDVLGGLVFRRSVLRLGATQAAPRHAAWDRAFASVLGGVEARWF
jgi:hypothetical protein